MFCGGTDVPQGGSNRVWSQGLACLSPVRPFLPLHGGDREDTSECLDLVAAVLTQGRRVS